MCVYIHVYLYTEKCNVVGKAFFYSYINSKFYNPQRQYSRKIPFTLGKMLIYYSLCVFCHLCATEKFVQ